MTGYCAFCGRWLDRYLGRDPVDHMCLYCARAIVRQFFAFPGIHHVDRTAAAKVRAEGTERDKRVLRVAERHAAKRRGER